MKRVANEADEPTPLRRRDPPPLPHSDEAERAVLGAMMMSRASIDTAADILIAEDFHRPTHQYIWSAIVELWAEGTKADAVLVSERLNRAGLLEAIGGAGEIVALPTYAPTEHIGGRIEAHCHIVADASRRRTLIRAASEAIQAAQHGGDIDRAVSGLVDDLTTEHGASHGGWDPMTDSEVDDILDRPPGWDAPTLMQVQNGPCLLYPGKVHSFAGESGSAKSWLMLLGCVQAIRAGQNVLYLDFEDSGGGIYQRLVDLGLDRDTAKRHLDYVGPTEAIDPARWRRLALLIQRRSYTLCVLDGVTEAMTAHGLNLLDNADIAKFLSLLPRRIAKLGPAVAMIDHVSKHVEGRKGALGGQHKKAGIDGAAFIVEALEVFGRGKIGRSKVTVDSKDRAGYINAATNRAGVVAVMELRSHEGGRVAFRLAAPVEHDTYVPTDVMERVSLFLEGTSGVSKATIEKTVSGKADTIRQAIDLLVAQGHITVKRGKHGAFEHTIHSPYRAPVKEDEEW